MAASFLRRPLRSLFVLLLLAAGLSAQAQVDNVYVYGTVKDQFTAKKLDGITVTVFKNGSKLAEAVTNASGKYEFNLDYGSEYKLLYAKPGMVSKNITIDTRNVPEEERAGGHGMNVEVNLFNELPGIDFSVLQQPIGKAKIDPTTNEMSWDLQYTAQIRSEIDRLMKEYEDKKKREAGADAEYAKLMTQGESAMTAADYKKAVESFTGALAIRSGDAKATARLSDAKMKLDELEGDKKKNEQYAALLKEADNLFGKKDYAGAKAKYEAASDVKEEEAYPKQKMKECQAFIDDLARKAEEEKKAKELAAKYQAAITAADAAFKGEKYDDAKAKYTEAAGLKPEEKYPKDQLAAIDKKLEELAKKAEEDKKAKELDAKYKAAIAAADAAFTANNFDQAKAKYTDASGIKPEEKYPKDQLAAIDKKLAELAQKAEEEKKAKELEEQYKAAIASADAAFKGEKYDDAKAKYTEALGLKPAEKYPKDQLAAIDKKLEELAKKAEEDKKAKELDGKYQAAIAAADKAFQGQAWEDAKAKYTEALGLKPAEKYPKDQLAAIDKAIADAARKAEEEKKAKELDAKYQALMDRAEQLFSAENYTEAKAKFQEALGVKPQEDRPKERIVEIDAKLAELAKQAAEEKKRQELEARYSALIARADKNFDTKKLSEALNDYKDALGLKPDEQHPKDRIAAIEQQLDADAKAKAEADRLAREKADLEQRYSTLIAKADKAFTGKQYEDARTAYTEALDVKPGEKHPTDRLAEIQRILDEQAAKAEADRQKAAQDAAERDRLAAEQRNKEQADAERNARYRAAIAKADIAFDQERYDAAREGYT
ncbi:MAG: hypothetical protein JST66_17090, partial [Bacteroidetes bacterium]|nr:hypothetical protein [Bacteroidota bacterium]